MELDRRDRRILKVLQREGRINNVDLAREVGLSPSACLRRVKLMEDAGIIERYVALLSPVKLGVGLSVFVRVWLKAQDEDSVRQFAAAVQLLPQVVECSLMAGECDFLLRVVAADLEDYRRFQTEQLSRIPALQQYRTEIPLEVVKATTELPV